MAIIHLGVQYSHQQKFTHTLSSFFRRLLVCNNNGELNLSYQSIHQSFSTWINILSMGTWHISRIGPFHTAVLHHLSSHHTAPSTSVPDCNFLWGWNYGRMQSASQTNQPVVVHMTTPTSSPDQSIAQQAVQREHWIKTDLPRLWTAIMMIECIQVETGLERGSWYLLLRLTGQSVYWLEWILHCLQQSYNTEVTGKFFGEPLPMHHAEAGRVSLH